MLLLSTSGSCLKCLDHLVLGQILGVSSLLTEKEAYHFMVNIDDQVVLVILQQLNDFLYVCLFFTKTN